MFSTLISSAVVAVAVVSVIKTKAIIRQVGHCIPSQCVYEGEEA
jgi:hypothetical protein